MLERTSDEIRLKALLGVVKNLIKNSRNTEIFRLHEMIKENSSSIPEKITREEFIEKRREEIKERVKEEVKEKLDKEKSIKNESLEKNPGFFTSLVSGKQKLFPRKVPEIKKEKYSPEFKVKRVLKIPKISFPEHLQSIRPVASEANLIDLGKLNPFVHDPNVSTLESDGENEPVYVAGSMGRKPTSVKLSRTEIEEVINRFSEVSRIPKSEGMFKVAVGKLLLTAMISSSVSPRFVIEKIRERAPPRY